MTEQLEHKAVQKIEGSAKSTPEGRITVNLVVRAVSALLALVERTRLSKTDIVNRGLQIYNIIDEEIQSGSKIIIERSNGERIHLLFS